MHPYGHAWCNGTCKPMFASLKVHNLKVVHNVIHNSQDMDTIQMSINRWLDKEDAVHTHREIPLSSKKEWNNVICSNMDAPRHDHTKWSDSERQVLYDITYMRNLNYDTNELIYRTVTGSRT